MKDKRDRPETRSALQEAEELIGKWDQEGGMSYRELAVRLSRIFGIDEGVEVKL
jgi:hypothetical protein